MEKGYFHWKKVKSAKELDIFSELLNKFLW